MRLMESLNKLHEALSRNGHHQAAARVAFYRRVMRRIERHPDDPRAIVALETMAAMLWDMRNRLSPEYWPPIDEVIKKLREK